MPIARDVATGRGIGKLARFAAGFAFAPSIDVATAGTPGSVSKSPTIGQRVRGGFSAASPGFREFEDLRRKKAISSAEFNQIQEETRIAKEEADKKKALALRPFDINQPLGAKATPEMVKATEDLFRRNNVDLDNNGVTTYEEVTKFLSSGSAGERASRKKELTRIAGIGIKNIQADNQVVDTKIQEELQKIRDKYGANLTPEQIRNNPTLASESKKLGEFMTQRDTNNKQSEAFTRFQVGVQRDIDEGVDEDEEITEKSVIANRAADLRDRGMTEVEAFNQARLEVQEEEQPTFTPEIQTQLDSIAEDLKVIDSIEDETEKRQLQFALMQEAMKLVPAEDQNRIIKFLRPFAPNAFAESLPQ